MKDHFAGSVAAVELLNHLISSHRGKTHEQFFIRLREEVAQDQAALQGLLHDLDAEGGAFRNTTAFLSEKLARIKLLLENPTGGQLAQLEKLEALALGIEGKIAEIYADFVNAQMTPPPNPTNGSLTLPSSLHSQGVIAQPLIPSSKPVNKGSTS